MKLLKNIAPITFLLFLTYCTNAKSEKSNEKEYSKEELIGKWNQVNPDNLLSDMGQQIEFIQLVNDSIAEIHVIDSIGKRKITGKWGNKLEKEILGAKIESDIHISFALEQNRTHILLLKLSEEMDELRMFSDAYKFIKE